MASLDIILFKKRIIKALIGMRKCTGWSAPLLFASPQRQVFSRGGLYDPYIILYFAYVLTNFPEEKKTRITEVFVPEFKLYFVPECFMKSV